MATTQLLVEILILGIITLASIIFSVNLLFFNFHVNSVLSSEIIKSWSFLITILYLSVSYLIGTIINFVSYTPFRKRFLKICRSKLIEYAKYHDGDKIIDKIKKDDLKVDYYNAYAAIDSMRDHIYQKGSEELSKNINNQWNFLRLSRGTLFSIAILSTGIIGYFAKGGTWVQLMISLILLISFFSSFFYYVLKRQEWFVTQIIRTYDNIK